MFTKKLIAAAVLGLGLTGAAQAGTVDFTFQPCGNAGCAVQTQTLDWAPGNVLALDGAGGGAPLPIGTAVTDLYQANLAVAQNSNGDIVFTNGGGGSFFSVVAGFGEVVNPLSAGNQTQFSFNPADPTNFFYVYADGTSGNNLTGAGFAGGRRGREGALPAVHSIIGSSLFAGRDRGWPGRTEYALGIIGRFHRRDFTHHAGGAMPLRDHWAFGAQDVLR